MATKQKTRSRDAQLAFEALSIEGGLLAPDWLARVAQVQAGNQAESDYGVHKGLNLRDEIGRYWRMAQANWNDLASGLLAGVDGQRLAERFVPALLRESFGFLSLQHVAPREVAGHTYPIGFAALESRVPVVVAPASRGLDTLLPVFGDGGRRRSAFGLCQEFLNAEEGALWGLACDGLTLRVLRDNTSLTRPAWLEADLERIFREARYADFAALWLLVHESRFGRPDQPVVECALEAWREAGRVEGTRAREHLRRGVEDALVALGQGFLTHPANQALRTALTDGSLTTVAYFQELLRLAYRLIFALTVEERGLLHGPQATDSSKALYREGYSLKRLRELSVRRSAHDRHHDLWQSVTIVFRGLGGGEPRLGLPALAGLFAPGQCPHLDAAKLENRALLLALFRLTWLREKAGLTRVNWRDMGPEELGSVYESLLELVPQIRDNGRAFAFATGDETRGNARKTSGSYYTPDSLVQVLLDSALEPVVEQTIAANPNDPAKALLDLSVVDPACGSGHFLLAAARRLAGHVARLQANGTPSAAEYRHALRQVVGHCIYGVDLNPMAVELCKVSLWMEAVEPGLPLTFLQSHIRHGNALLGATPELMEKGIPDAAWEPIEGDDKATASALKKRNKKAIKGQLALDLWSTPTANEANDVARAVAALDAATDADAEALAQKESQWQGLLDSPAYRHQRSVADAWCAAFVWPKKPGPSAEAAPTNDVWWALKDGVGQPPPGMVETTRTLADQYTFFHWHLAFPQVFARGGFDVVLGNPPWERVKLQEQEYFASRSDDIAGAPNAAARKKLIAALRFNDPMLWESWCVASRAAEGQSHCARASKRYPLCGQGDVNTYALFAENNLTILCPKGRAGFIVPTGIATDDTTKDYFQYIVFRQQLRSLFDFQSGPGLFGSIGHGTFKLCLLTVSASGIQQSAAQLSFYSRTPQEATAANRLFALNASEFELLNPNTKTCPTFRSQRDADINISIYRRSGVFVRDNCANGNPWAVDIRTRLWHMAEDAEHFRTETSLLSDNWIRSGSSFVKNGEIMLPLYEAKMIYLYDHRYGDYAQQPTESENSSLPDVPVDRLSDPWFTPIGRYWVPENECHARLENLWQHRWLIGWRDITKPQNERTVISSIIPYMPTGNTTPLLFANTDRLLLPSLYANMCSLAIDYAARQKIGGTHLTFGYLKQLPVLRPSVYLEISPWTRDGVVRDWLLPRVLELTYTAWDLEPFARDVGYDGPPFRWDPARRFLLRAELDAAFFHLYGLSRDDTAYILDTFPIVRKNDEKAHGEYRTKRVILEVYDAMAEAIRTSQPYQTILDPPPADPRVAHPPRAMELNLLEWSASLADGSLARPRSDPFAEYGMALAATLKALGRATPIREVRLAVVLALEPRLAVFSLDATESAEWLRLIGTEAQAVPQGVVSLASSANIAWGQALAFLRGRRMLVEDAQGATWAPGVGLDTIDTAGWPDGRARWVVDVLRRRGKDALVLALPDSYGRWVNDGPA